MKQTAQMVELLQQNTQMTEIVQELNQRIEALTREIHTKVVQEGTKG